MKSYVYILSACCIISFFAEFTSAARIQRVGKAGSPDAPARRALTVYPQNVAALVGETVLLSCSSDVEPPASRVMWTEYISNPLGSGISDNLDILNHPNRARYRIVQSVSTDFYLEISNLQLSDGGTYNCQDTLGTLPEDRQGSAELIVIANNPNCTNTLPDDGNVVEGNPFTLECILYYQGAFAPTMTWSGPPPFVVTGASNPDNVWSLVEFIVDRSMDTRQYECLSNFTTIPDQPTGVASNTPTWNYLYRANQLFVFWGPMNMRITPYQDEYAVGDVLTCYADAFPPANYVWYNLRTTSTLTGDTFVVTPDLYGTNQTLRCQAINTIQEYLYSNNIFSNLNVPAETTPTTTPTTPEITTLPYDSPCQDLTGFWTSTNPPGELGLTVYEDGQIGEIFGLFKNASDDIRVEVIGTVDLGDFSLVGLSAIFPGDAGLVGMSGECHRCAGVEVIIFDTMWRSIADSDGCGDGGNPTPHLGYTFYRSATTLSESLKDEIKVYRPTNISKRLGVKLAK